MLDALKAFARRGVELHVVGRGRIEVESATGYLMAGVEGLLAEAVRGTDGALWHAWTFPRNGWSWEGLGGVIVGPPSIVTSGTGLLDVFARGADNRLWHIPFR